MRRLLFIALIAALAACTGERAPASKDTSTPAEASGDSAPPATPSTSAPEGSAAPPPAPAPSPQAADMQASFAGYGDVKFGTAAADMAQAWGGELRDVGKDFNDRCYFMTPSWVKTPAEFNFMVSDGKFVRFGTESAKYLAPGGGKVGMRKAEIAGLHAGLEEQPHKYTDGLYLRVRDPAGGNGVLVYEVDGTGDDATVTEWRVGVPPEVDYVEGCS
ncbi:MAG TPA: lectin [Thermomonas sp.]|nr:lectin [Thermomonas sp.]